MSSRKKRWLAWLLAGALMCSQTAVIYAEEDTAVSSETTSEAPAKESAESTADTDRATDTAAPDESKTPDTAEPNDGETDSNTTTGAETPEEGSETPTPEDGEPADEETGAAPEDGETPDGETGDTETPDDEDPETPDSGDPSDDEDGETDLDFPVILPLLPVTPDTDVEELPDMDAPATMPTEDQLEAMLPNIGVLPEEPSVPEEDVISISSLEELALIGVDEDYPLDGEYELTCDIYGGEMDPIGSPEAPFSGIFYGYGYVIAGVTVTGDSAGFFGALTGEVYDLTLTDFSVYGDTAGILAGEMSGATVSNVLVTGTVDGDTAGAVAGSAEDTDWDDVIYFTGTNLPAVGEGDGDGPLMLRSQPPYIAIVLGQTAELAASGRIGHFRFSHFEGTDGFTLADSEDKSTTLTPEDTGKFTLTAVYTLEVDDEEVVLEVNIPVIIGVDDAGLEELSTLDGVFYEKLGDYEVVQISALEPLQLLEGVFAETILQEQQTAITNDVPINKITSWEDFKNIGNTDYDPDYTMYAVYLLDCDIESDGEPFTPIGTEDNPFYGEFDGRVYSIDLTNNPEIDTEAEYCGLFGVVLPPPETAADADDTLSEPDEEPDTAPETDTETDSEPDTAPEPEEEAPDTGANPAPETDSETDTNAETIPETETEELGDETL